MTKLTDSFGYVFRLLFMYVIIVPLGVVATLSDAALARTTKDVRRDLNILLRSAWTKTCRGL